MGCKISLVFLLIIALIAVINASIPPTASQIHAKLNAQHLLNTLHRQIKAKEAEMQNAETINRNFERMIQLVNILGQVDNFLTERTKNVIKKLALLVEDEEKFASSED
ncbi:uncharacterized protein LOC103313367 [Tribolium castaneum]|uniref:Uncharacterized protein n=1 Tax=Tribolium castaneum TaxID=7070 RepID=D2A5B3_TRICA|nr:PREDICTED: uncharacterized protein LOC103313367 [Tribolium castaneum]EFA05340.1 hypothetical protein TcasGA2_TC015504 [Tribolium castaneum]|eukprot:XP_008194656.1 PREDICTED: uncharacterized protein LOC103313367 [Tribolium castaneum]